MLLPSPGQFQGRPMLHPQLQQQQQQRSAIKRGPPLKTGGHEKLVQQQQQQQQLPQQLPAGMTWGPLSGQQMPLLTQVPLHLSLEQCISTLVGCGTLNHSCTSPGDGWHDWLNGRGSLTVNVKLHPGFSFTCIGPMHS